MKKITRLCITYLCLITSLSASEFAEVSVKEFPKVRTFSPAPAIAYPENAIATTFENHGNYWALLPAEKKAQFSLHVLNAKNPVKWETDTLSGIRDGKWRWLEADMHGYIWLSDGSQACRINVKNPQSGPVVISADTAFPAKKITAMGLGPNGSMLFATKNGKLVEAVQAYDNKARMQRNQITVIDCPKNVQKIYTDRHGTIWLKARNKAFKKEAPADAWQKNWERTWDLPGGSHDLSGDIYNGKFYMSWAITGDFGYPSKGNFHSKVLQFDPKSGWSIFADYGYPRGYGGTSFLDDKIWAVAGDALDKDKKRFTTRASQIIDPASGKVSNGPDLPAKLAASIALNVNGRLYVTGYGGEGKNLKLYSIGKGEDKWTAEKEGPEGAGSAYGTQMGGVLYVATGQGFLCYYDTKTREWSKSKVPNGTRSPAVGHYKGEVWVMGGRNGLSEKATHIYNPKTKKWRRGPDLPRALCWGTAFNIAGEMYVTGGFSYDSTFNQRTFRLRGK